jgi:hypothetical protein
MPKSFDRRVLDRLINYLQRPRSFGAIKAKLDVDRATVYVWLRRADETVRAHGQELVLRDSLSGPKMRRYQLIGTGEMLQ